jgi:nucleoside-diphosphate-sugar epimerase
VADIGKAERILGWRPAVNCHDGIERMMQWVRCSMG